MSESKDTRKIIKNMIEEIDELLPEEHRKKFDDIRDWANGGEYKYHDGKEEKEKEQ